MTETELVIDQPFSLFRPFHDRFEVKFFTKQDNIQTDDDLRKKLNTEKLASLWQVHANRTLTVRSPISRLEQADALATEVPDLWLSIRAADCQQLVVYAPEKNVCAVIHAGWKGLKAGMIASCFRTLKQQWDTDPAQTYVGIGPSLCTNCAEFTDPVTELAGLDPQFFHGRHADLRGIADAQLRELSVEHLERSPDCTKCMADTYWSYRGGDREKVKEGFTNVLTCRLTR